MENITAISFQNLSVGYGNQVVLKNINLKLSRGQLICFMGPNGAGKSTLIKTICQFIKPLSGTIRINDLDGNKWTMPQLARQVSVVLTDTLNAGQLTGKELVASGRYPYTGWSGRLQAEDWRVVEEAMEKTFTTRLSGKLFYEMSDGQRQKIMIARALCQETPIIILDEPTAHLDLNNRVAIVTLLRDLAHEENRAVLMATHELDLALQLADYLWLAEPTRSIIEGIPEDLVLNGTLDRVFQFKGYDLKTGSVFPRRTGRKVQLTGSDFLYLWTKNALERNGYELEESAETVVKVYDTPEHAWELNGKQVTSIKSLLDLLNEHFVSAS